ncbi:MAG: glycine--tRNA ligase [Candidatus Pacebacteria bacterium]|nr:glycine--tRNA ligase [Candidatus Paceibacterota bacterium]MDD2757501.1 glycine--tRNA ligase [Candidatus Paceibacterota bacterium]MDD3283644.1 glycine--tRNA ligase [Candidatus Paceibacterota bacterium]MDD3969733.1 glycine--tRNA ligase [Candidatus Paceibacterota bacterium]MDD4737672.1 glycine--tRNA ligase [Candidatus Paceibacterota bacterium]
MENNSFEKIISFAKRRGFVFQSSDIYGGIGGFYDFGPLGIELRNNIKNSWWNYMVRQRDNVFGLDSSIIMNPNVWKASGHTETFSDPLSECKKCHKRFRTDHLKENNCPECKGELMESRNFNLMFRTFVGPVEDSASMAYLRPETAQGIFVNYRNILNTQRTKIPFGIAQVGKAFRNEITPGNFIFRLREFEQMEMEYFVEPGKEDEALEYWVEQRMNWYVDILGIKRENLRARKQEKDELAHYSKGCFDIEYNFPVGWSEIEGIASRGDFDLSQHQKFSGEDLNYFDDQTKEKYLPYVVEPSCGLDRTFLAVLCDAFTEVEGGRTTTTESNKEKEFLLKLNSNIAPIKVAVLPLVKNKEEITNKAKEVYNMLKKNFSCQYDETGAIGRRYRRQDEIGTPFAVTIDFDSIINDDVTLRNRDTMEQQRVKISDLTSIINEN